MRRRLAGPLLSSPILSIRCGRSSNTLFPQVCLLFPSTDLQSTNEFPGAYCVDAEDVALLHLAGLVHADVQNERLFAFGNPFTWSQIVVVFKKLCPGRTLAEGMFGQGKAERFEIEPAARAEGLLREMGKEGFSSLEETLKANVADLVQVG